MEITIPAYIWKVIVAVGVVGGVISAVWAMEDRYIQKPVLEQAMGNVDLKFDLFRLENLRDQEMKYKVWIRENPNDPELKDDFKALLDRKKELKTKIDNQLNILKSE